MRWGDDIAVLHECIVCNASQRVCVLIKFGGFQRNFARRARSYSLLDLVKHDPDFWISAWHINSKGGYRQHLADWLRLTCFAFIEVIISVICDNLSNIWRWRAAEIIGDCQTWRAIFALKQNYDSGRSIECCDLNVESFYPRDAMLARVIAIATCPSVCPSVRLCVCPSRAGIVSKRRKLAAWFLNLLVATRL